MASNSGQFYATQNASYLLAAANESVYVVLYLMRERAVTTSTSFWDWAIAFLATFLGTLLRPADPLNTIIGSTLIVVGVALNIFAALSLGKSISIVPAERGIKTRGFYRYVRHPMYASGIVTLLGYLIANFSVPNVCFALGTALLLLLRIEHEELFLSRNEAYRNYVAETKWKLMPGVY